VRVQIWQACAQAARPILWIEAVAWLRDDASELRKLLARVFRVLPYTAFFWECSPVSPATAGARWFEFVALPAPALEAARADSRPFAEHLDQYRGLAAARTFANLRGDSMLVAPTMAQMQDPAAYTHIARFFREAPEAQQMILLREVGVAIDQALQTLGESTNLWVSTAGLNVYWLSVRLDPKPKYYQHKAYKNSRYMATDDLAQHIAPQYIGVRTGVRPPRWEAGNIDCPSVGEIRAPVRNHQGFRVHSFHVSVHSDRPARGNYFGIVLYKKGDATEWFSKFTEVRVRSGFIYITDESCLKDFPTEVGAGHGAAYRRLFGERKPADVIASGFSIMDGVWNFDSSFNTGHAYADGKVSMNEHEQRFVTKAVTQWMRTGSRTLKVR